MQVVAGDWSEFFGEPQPADWGGSETMGSASSLNFLWNEIKKGDLVLAWQTDQRAAVGLCRVHDLEDWIDSDGEAQRAMILRLEGEPFSPPVPLLDLRKTNSALAKVSAFSGGYPATLYSTSAEEAKVILKACGVHKVSSTGSEGEAPGLRTGSGFGTAAENKKVEMAAVEAFKLKYRQWDIEDLQAEKVGYDFLVSRGSAERHVEVKGVRGTQPSFPITDNEVKMAMHDPLWHLCVVTSALGPKPVITEWNGERFLKEFSLRPLTTYLARLKP